MNLIIFSQHGFTYANISNICSTALIHILNSIFDKIKATKKCYKIILTIISMQK